MDVGPGSGSAAFLACPADAAVPACRWQAPVRGNVPRVSTDLPVDPPTPSLRRRLLKRGFFRRAPELVAPELLGKLLVTADGRCVRLVETEAYAQEDPAAHTHRGETARNRSMFGPPGHLYVYFTYGMHWCANLVCGPPGYGAGVLLRAAEPLAGLELMQSARGGVSERDLCRGPGRLAQALGIDGRLDGLDVLRRGPVMVMDDGVVPGDVAACVRVGISRSVEAALRFVVAGNRYVSRPPARLSG